MDKTDNDNLSYIVLDFETTVRNTVGTNKASPHNPANEVVCLGYKTDDMDDAEIVTNTSIAPIPSIKKGTIVVGCNLPFDLQWQYREISSTNLVKNNIWDVSMVEYILTGQQHKLASLDQLAEKYLLPVKDDRIKKMWEAGIQTEDIPTTMLHEYCKHDVKVTEQIFLQQILIAKKQGQLQLIKILHDASLATIEMMHHGMYVDKDILSYSINIALAQRIGHMAAIFTQVSHYHPGLNIDQVNLESNQQLSAIIYGGTFKYKEAEHVGKYKTGSRAGEDKYVTKNKTLELPHIVDPVKHRIPANTQGYQTDVATIERLLPHIIEGITLLQIILRLRDTNKELNTYLLRTQALLYGNIIHHNINNNITSTGRLSSSEPNLQNVSNKKESLIKKCYTSRYANGRLVEMDFKQLEVVALALLSEDKQLITDLNNDVDIHSTLYVQVYKYAPTATQRKEFKRAVFAMIYGASATKISSITGMSLGNSRRMMMKWYERYPGVVAFNKDTTGRVWSNYAPSSGTSTLTAPSGRRLTYKMSTGADGKQYFSRNMIYNYPIQSLATGDIVALFLGTLWRNYAAGELFRNKCVLINTVHDSVLIDCSFENVPAAEKLLRLSLKQTNESLERELNVKALTPIVGNIKVGATWADLEEVS